MRYVQGGRLLQLSFARSPGAQWNAEHFGERAGKRGVCKGFSFGSRRRMLNLLNSVSVASKFPWFVTLTVPDDVFLDSVSEFAKVAKIWKDNFTKRLQRVCPTAAGFWRIEWQARKSGRHEGKLFPHFHLMVWGLPERSMCPREVVHDHHSLAAHPEPVCEAYVDVEDNQLSWDLLRTFGTRPAPAYVETTCETEHRGVALVFSGKVAFVERCRGLLSELVMSEVAPNFGDGQLASKMSLQDWASLAWYHVVDSHNVDHLAAGVRVEKAETWGGVMSYCAKYCAKLDCNFMSEVAFGRSWGVFNRAGVPWGNFVDIDLDSEVGVRLRRVARHFLERVRRRKPGDRRWIPQHGVTLYCNVEQWLKLCRPPDPF